MQCQYCDKIFLNSSCKEVHQKTCDYKVRDNAEVEDQMLSGATLIMNQMLANNDIPVDKTCFNCNKKFKARQGLIMHFRTRCCTDNPNLRFRCKDCGFATYFKFGFEKHRATSGKCMEAKANKVVELTISKRIQNSK